MADPQPSAIPPPDRHQLERLNSLYRIIDNAPPGGGLKARFASGARRLMGRVLSRQQEFNAALVDHINRNVVLGFEAPHASVNTIQWVAAVVDRCEGAKDEIQRHLEALLARERRNDTAVTALASQHQELRAALAVVQQAAHGLRRAIEAGVPTGPRTPDPRQPPASQFDDLDSHKYVGFEDQFRGSPEEIRRRVEEYLPVFANATDVLDVGCGRGEFLELLREHGIRARGIDVNPAMVDVCLGKGLEA